MSEISRLRDSAMASTTRQWSSRRGKPETAMVPTNPRSRLVDQTQDFAHIQPPPVAGDSSECSCSAMCVWRSRQATRR